MSYRPPFRSPIVTILLGMIASTSLAAGVSPITLRPYAIPDKPCPTVFYQAVPLAAGELKLKEPALARPSPESLAILKPIAYWPDGSVKWLSVEGSVRGEQPADALPLALVPPPETVTSPRKVVWGQSKITIQDEKGETLLSLAPSASCIAITQIKRPQPSDADSLDEKAQYSWAAPLNELTAEAEAIDIPMEVREGVVEEDNAVYTLYRIRGSGSQEQGAPGSQVEWQLRLRCYHDIPLVRMQMSWIIGCDARKYAITSAALKIEGCKPLKSAELEGHAPIDLRRETAGVFSDANGANRIVISGNAVAESPAPAPERGVVLIESETEKWALAIPDLNQLGPNHLLLSRQGVEIASWSGKSGAALDLRRSSESESDFGMRAVDMNTDGTGFSRSTEIALILGRDAEQNRTMALREARRDWIWLPNAADLERSAALGPFSQRTVADNRDYFEGLRANLHFVLASRERWRWKGYANFGDWRTNFALGTNPVRGLVAGRWALSGRYGWRNASGEPHGGTLTAALFLEDRALALASLDYARHIADVDVRHGSFWRPAQGPEGGMHRRNRDHWSGSVQMQYTSARGLYLASWVTGDARIREVLGEIRDFGRRDNVQTGALSYGARAWIFRYMETLDPAALTTARTLLEKASADWIATSSWGQKYPDYPLGSLYFENNTRRIGEGAGTIEDFYEATGDSVYLQTLREMVKADGVDPLNSPALGQQGIIGYLLSQGVPAAEIGGGLLQAAGVATKRFQPAACSDFVARDYDTLAAVITRKLPPEGNPAYRETAAIGQRAISSFFALKHFGNGAPALDTATANPGTTSHLSNHDSKN